jgi:hypothetical protein
MLPAGERQVNAAKPPNGGASCVIVNDPEETCVDPISLPQS